MTTTLAALPWPITRAISRWLRRRPGLAPHVPHPALAAAAERIADLEAVMVATREHPVAPARPQVTVTADDLPVPARAFRPDELDLLTYLARVTDDALTGDGDLIADTLRRRFPDSCDSNLARVVLALIWITADIWRSSSCDPAGAWGALEDALAAAALHLASLEMGAAL